MKQARVTPEPLRRLARAYGVQTSYYDVDRVRHHAAPEALLAILRALDVPVTGFADVAAEQRRHDEAARRPGIAPVHVAWDGELPPLRLYGPVAERLSYRLIAEDGTTHAWSGRPRPVRGRRGQAGWRTGLRARLPLGYHRLEIRSGRDAFHTRVIAAPRRAFVPADRRAWGVFLPLYALRSDDDRGVGSYGDLLELARWTGTLGGDFTGTLPLLATFLSAPFEPSPYAPASRLFWSDLFIDPAGLPGAGESERAGAAPATPPSGDLVDYRRAAAHKRSLVQAAAQRFFAAPAGAQAELREFLTRRPDAADYARFRAVCDRRREGWPVWPDRLRAGDIRAGDFDDADERYHLYASWVAERQIGAVARARAAGAAALYLDLPLGVHRDGYDTWRMPQLFALEVSAGAPPDTFFRAGQSWGFPPLKPDALREDGHAYFIACVRHHLRSAGALRLDHVMALQRLYWIPRGFEPTDGVYVRYPLDEMFAVLTLESARHEAVIIGEDLGTVSREIRSAMGRHRVQRMFVLQFEASPDRRPPMPQMPRDVIASLNTHDMPTFAAYWQGLDIEDRHALGLLNDDEAEAEREQRARLRARLLRQLRLATVASGDGRASARAVLTTLLERVAGSRARILLVNLEDLWLETRPQNVPGTSSERPNWRRRATHDLDRIRQSPEVVHILERVARLRDDPDQDHG